MDSEMVSDKRASNPAAKIYWYLPPQTKEKKKDEKIRAFPAILSDSREKPAVLFAALHDDWNS
eukprot:6490693-Amphidinium_carterae.1